MPCSPLIVNRHFGGTWRLCIQGRRINQARNQREGGSQQSLLRLFFDPEDGVDIFLRKVCSLSTDLRAGRPGIDSRQCKIFIFSATSKPGLRPTQSPIQWVPGTISLGVKRQGCEADLYLMPRSRMVKLYLQSPTLPFFLHSIISQKIELFTTTAVRTLNPTR
jgi:hypothetical protein